jgi:hypothetical protein
MSPYSIEELNLMAAAIQRAIDKHFGPNTVFFLVLADGKHCGAIGTVPAELATDIRDIMAELSARPIQHNN